MIARGREMEQDDWRAFGLSIATQVGTCSPWRGPTTTARRRSAARTEHAALLDAMIEGAPDYVAHSISTARSA